MASSCQGAQSCRQLSVLILVEHPWPISLLWNPFILHQWRYFFFYNHSAIIPSLPTLQYSDYVSSLSFLRGICSLLGFQLLSVWFESLFKAQIIFHESRPQMATSTSIFVCFLGTCKLCIQIKLYILCPSRTSSLISSWWVMPLLFWNLKKLSFYFSFVVVSLPGLSIHTMPVLQKELEELLYFLSFKWSTEKHSL